MALTLGSLSYLLGVDTRQFDAGIAQAERRARGANDNIESSFRRAGLGVDDLGQRTRRLPGALDDVGRAVDGTSGRFGRLRGVAGELGGVLPGMELASMGVAGGLAAAGLAAGAFAVDAANAAGDLQQAQSKVTAVFGDSEGAVTRFAQTSTESLGISEREALSAAGGIGQLLIQAGALPEAAAGMSVGLVEAAANMSAFHNVSRPEAIQAVSSALIGEYDSLQRLGIGLSDAGLQTYALKEGFAGLDGVLQQSEKTLAAQAYIVENQGAMLGAAAREAGTLAGAQAALSAAWEDARGVLGEGLVPVLTELTQTAADALEWIKQHPEVIDAIGQAAAGAVEPLTRIGTIIADVGRFAEWTDTQAARLGLGIGGVGSSAAAAVAPGQAITGVAVELGGALDSAAASAARQAGATQRATTEVIYATPVIEQMSDELDRQKASADAVRTSLDLLTGGTLSHAEANLRQHAAADAARESIEQHGVTMDINTEAGRANQQALIDLAQAGQDQLVSMREQGFGVEDLTGQHLQFRSGLQDVAQQMGLNSDEARQLADQYLGVPGEVRTNFEAAGVGEAVRNVEVFRAALDGIGRTVMQVDGRFGMTFRAGAGGRVTEFAHGGVEDHVAQIARPGAMRLWAEPETGGEAYIPLSPSKRSRSTKILQEVADRFGLGLHEYAGGGIALPAQVAFDWRNVIEKMPPVPALGPGIGYQAMVDVLKRQFPDIGITSTYRPGAITATGNKSYHGMGRAVDMSPRMDVFNWLRSGYMAATKELIFSPANGLQVWNGQNHMYTGVTRANHWDHIHWAMENGGILEALTGLADAYRSGGGGVNQTFNVNDISGNSTETARRVAAMLSAVR